ncbi:MAG: rhombosortase [Nibricoccus sp.]
MKRFPWLTLLLAILATAIHLSPTLTTALQFEPLALQRGEIWRVFTGHFTHFGTDHLRWDVIAFSAFGSLAEIRSRRALLLNLSIGAIVIALGVAWLQPQFSIYRGLSGIDSALFAFVAADLLRTGWRTRDRLMLIFGTIALTGFITKSSYEVFTGSTLFVETSSEFQAVPLAHLLGATVGAIIACNLKNDKADPVALTSSPATRVFEKMNSRPSYQQTP